MDCCTTNKKEENHKEHHSHQGKHDHHSHGGGHGMSHGDAGNYLKRFFIVTALLIPLIIFHPKISEFLGLVSYDWVKWLQFGIATIIFGFAWVFFQHASHEIKAKQYGMMTLVSLAVLAGYLFSVASTFLPSLHAEFYIEISTLIWVLLFGHYLEAKSSGAAGDALSEVAKLLPKKAHKISDNKEIEVDISELQENDLVIVKPGEKVPADGTIFKGYASVDESLISGESKPVEKKEGDGVVAGSICLDGSLTINLNRVGENSTVGQIKKLIEEAGRTKPRSEKIADKAAAVLTFIALITSLATILVWTLIIGETFTFAITLAITVLVIACPHALGLAIPTVTTITTSLAVKNGFFIKDLSKIEIIRKADYVVFDKTGTLTEGRFGVSRAVALSGKTENELIRIAASLDKNSSHIIGKAIVDHALSKEIRLDEVKDFQYISGEGVVGNINGEKYFGGNQRLMKRFGVGVSSPEDAQGTVIFVANEGGLVGYIILSDAIKNSSHEAIATLHNMGVKVAMLTGDNKEVAASVAKELNIDLHFAEVLPEDKYKYIKDLQSKGNIVLMVGDGVNDAPALRQADAGAAIGAGTDVAVESGDVVLTDNDPGDIARLINLSRAVYRKMIQNLIWALGYNIVAIPAAAGVFALWGFFLRPEIGALVMSLSTVIVVLNAMSLKRLNLK